MILFHNWANLAASFSLLDGIYIKNPRLVTPDKDYFCNDCITKFTKVTNFLPKKYQQSSLTSANLRDRVALKPFFFGSLLSPGIKQALKAPGNDWKRDLSIPNVRIWNKQNKLQTKQQKLKYQDVNWFETYPKWKA